MNGGNWDKWTIQSAITMDSAEGPRVLVAHFVKRKYGYEGHGTYNMYTDRLLSHTCFCFARGRQCG